MAEPENKAKDEDKHLLTSSENTNNENREIEMEQAPEFMTDVEQPSEGYVEDQVPSTSSELVVEKIGDKDIDKDCENLSTTLMWVEQRSGSSVVHQDPPSQDEAIVPLTSTKLNVEKFSEISLEVESTEEQLPVASTSTEQELSKKVGEEDDKYAAHVKYNDDGTAIYTDPETKFQYKWSEEKHEWVPLEEGKAEENPFENEHYKWCHDTSKWIPKDNPKETEFYKWCDETSTWIPKIQQTEEGDGKTYSFENGVHLYTDRDGIVFFWDTEKNAWFPRIDDDFMAMYQMNYGFIDNTSEPSKSAPKTEKVEKRKEIEDKVEEGETAGKKRKAPAEPPKWFEVAPEQNTKVYVSNLPLDITDEEFAEIMAKCGMVMKDVNNGKLKLKLYRDAEGKPKGDGLCNYIKIESVELALNILDNYDVRGNKISVQRAQFQMRGDYNPALKPKMKKKEKEKIKKMQQKLFDWRPEKMRGERAKHERIVILKNLFEPNLFEKEVQLLLDYQKDLREECGKCGTVRKVIVFDRHAEGVAQVTMADPDEADLVVQLMNGRFFGKRKLTAETWDGKTKYRIAESEAEVTARLDNWEKYLEARDDAKEEAEKKVEEKVEEKEKE